VIDGIIYVLGLLFAALILTLLAWLIIHIGGNIYGGFIGALRYRRLRFEHYPGQKRAPRRWVIRQALSCWSGGNRYDGHVGLYWPLGPLQIPVDGRSPIPPEKHFG